MPGEVVSPDFVDHNPMPGQPAGSGALLYIYNTLHNEDMLAEDDKVAVRWILRGTNTGGMFGAPPTNQMTTEEAIVVFRIKEGKVTDRWAQIGRQSV